MSQNRELKGTVRIEMTAHGRGKVYLDGAEILRVESVSFRARAGHANRVHLVILTDQLTIVAPAEISEQHHNPLQET